MKYLSLLTCLFLSLNLATAQNLDEELGFIYVKADYLLETDRYEEAIAEYTKIINTDPAFKDALYKRATAKYAIAAYKGVKLDLLRSFEFKGITEECILLYGKTLEYLGEDESASNTMKIASKLYPEDKKAAQYKDEEIVKNEPASTDNTTEETIKEEVKKLEDKISSILEDLLPEQPDSDDMPSGNETQSGDEPTGSDSGNVEGDPTHGETESDTPPKAKVYIPDNSVNEIYIDEDLTLEIKSGLGNRKVLEQPNILILSETAGDVAVDVCVNRNGKVTSAEYNQQKSNLEIQSLISLAVRKSKEFWFEKSDQKEICGTIVFHISGRN